MTENIAQKAARMFLVPRDLIESGAIDVLSAAEVIQIIKLWHSAKFDPSTGGFMASLNGDTFYLPTEYPMRHRRTTNGI